MDCQGWTCVICRACALCDHPWQMKQVVGGDETTIKQVNQRAWQSAIVLIILLLLITLMIWALVSFGSYLYSLIASLF